MTGPTFHRGWTKEQLANPSFETAIYSARLRLPDPFAPGLVTRDGRVAVVEEITATGYARGTVDGEPCSWYASEWQGKWSVVEHADALAPWM